jgi:hypothetical protein
MSRRGIPAGAWWGWMVLGWVWRMRVGHADSLVVGTNPANDRTGAARPVERIAG